jgi:uncharacterized repeat protein (TIGR01451 family)
VTARFRFLSSANGILSPTCDALLPGAEDDGFRGWWVDAVRLGCAPAALALSRSARPAFAAPGETVTFTRAGANPAAAPADLEVWDSLPAGAALLGSSPTGSLSGQVLTFSVPAAPAGGTGTLSYSVLVPSLTLPQDWQADASGASSADPGARFRSNQALVRLRTPALTLRKRVRRNVVTQNEGLTFDLVATNESGRSLSGFRVEDSLPASFSYVDSSLGAPNGGAWGYPPSGTDILGPGESLCFTLAGLARGEAGVAFLNTAHAGCTQFGWVSATASYSFRPALPEDPQLKLWAVYPNPALPEGNAFGRGVHVAYDVGRPARLRLTVYTVAGEPVSEQSRMVPPGRGELVWDLKNQAGQAVAGGLYVFHLKAFADNGAESSAYGKVAVLP